jgi:hypothetical protein
VTVGFFEEVKGIEESSAFGPFSGKLNGRIPFKGSSSIGRGCCRCQGCLLLLLCALLLRGTLLSKELCVDLDWGGHYWLDFYLAGGCNWWDID